MIVKRMTRQTGTVGVLRRGLQQWPGLHWPVRGTALPAPMVHQLGIPGGSPLVVYGDVPVGSQYG